MGGEDTQASLGQRAKLTIAGLPSLAPCSWPAKPFPLGSVAYSGPENVSSGQQLGRSIDVSSLLGQAHARQAARPGIFSFFI